ncbi:hypothetical protein EDD22DRAFT_738626, partial [Suillus occidentalis]
ESTTRRVYSDSILHDHGPGVTISDLVLDCAHYQKIYTLDDLHKETKWSRVNHFGDDIIAVIK